MADAVEFLDHDRILDGIEPHIRNHLSKLDIYSSIDSTNNFLKKSVRSRPNGGWACLAERQTAGRGRHGRTWVSPFAANLYLSLLWPFARGPERLSGLSLAVGIAVARALEALEVGEIALKWPNDILWRQRKLGGILVEFAGNAPQSSDMVLGVGINVAMPQEAAKTIDQPWVDLRNVLGPVQLSRNLLAARVLNEMIEICLQFQRQGFQCLRSQWERFDGLVGRQVLLNLPDKTVKGTVHGVDDLGALRLETGDGIKSFIGGEISYRSLS